eukprot:354060-Chlamydomonas_euryale.AAC.8
MNAKENVPFFSSPSPATQARLLMYRLCCEDNVKHRGCMLPLKFKQCLALWLASDQCIPVPLHTHTRGACSAPFLKQEILAITLKVSVRPMWAKPEPPPKRLKPCTFS